MPGEFQFEAVKLEDTFVTSSHLKTKTNSQFDLESTLKFFNGPKKVFKISSRVTKDLKMSKPCF